LYRPNMEWRALYSQVRPSSTTTHLLQQGSLFQACFKHGSYTIIRVNTVFLSSKLVEISLLEPVRGMAVEFEIFWIRREDYSHQRLPWMG
jgi:hypothetical protein